MKKRCLAFVLLLCLFALPAHATKTKEVLTFYGWGGAEITAATGAGLDGFAAAQRQRVLPYPRSFPTREEYAAWLTEQFASGWPGDVVEMDAEMLRTLAKDAQGNLRLQDLEVYRRLVALKQFSYLGLAGCTVDGQLSAVPVSMSAHGFFWNTTALTARGFGVPANIADLRLLTAVILPEADRYALAADAQSRMALLITFLQSKYGQPWLDTKGLSVSFSPDQVAEGLTYLANLEQMRILPKLAEQGDITEGWRQGKYLGVWAWNDRLDFLQSALPADADGKPAAISVSTILEDWGAFGGGFQRVSRMLAIPKTASAPETGAKLLEYLLNSKRGARSLLATRGIPDSAAALAACKTGKRIDPAAIDRHQAVLIASRYLMPLGFDAPALANSGGVYEEILLGISDGTLTPEAAAKQLTDEIAKVLAQP